MNLFTNTETITQGELNNALWSAADSSRTSLDAGVYKDYVLAMLFFKYLSDLSVEQEKRLTEKYGEDKERIKRKMKMERFYIPKDQRFAEVYKQREEDTLGQTINQALEAIEEQNRDKLEGIFRNIDFNSEAVLGRAQQRNKMLRDLLSDFHKLDLTRTNQDILGNAYMYLIERFGSEAGKKSGEFYTPRQISRLLAKLSQPEPGDRICDPACGSGSLLLLAGEEVKKQGSDNFALYGQESTGTTYQLCRMNMFLHGMDSARVEWGDTLNHPQLLEHDHLMRFDTQVANPPFSLKKWGADNAEGDQWRRFDRGIPPKDKGDYAFILHMLATAQPKSGRVAVIVPHGVLFRGGAEGKIRQSLLEDNLIDAVIGLPAGLFQTTGIPVAILILDRGREAGGAKADQKQVLFVEASKEFTPGKAQNSLDNPHIEKIYSTYAERKEIEKFSRLVGPEEIKENDYNLNITRYVDTFKEEESVDIAANLQALRELEPKLKELERQMQEHLQKLNLEESA